MAAEFAKFTTAFSSTLESCLAQAVGLCARLWRLETEVF